MALGGEDERGGVRVGEVVFVKQEVEILRGAKGRRWGEGARGAVRLERGEGGGASDVCASDVGASDVCASHVCASDGGRIR